MSLSKNPGELIHWGAPVYLPELFEPVLNEMFYKPSGGLWTSPVDSTHSWEMFNNRNDIKDYEAHEFFKLRLSDTANVLVVDSEKDLEELPTISLFPNWPLLVSFLDFEKLAETYDALWLTAKGQRATRGPMGKSLCSWDCETVLIMKSDCIKIS